MNKIPETKARKGLRITLCVLYLLEIVLCTWPYIEIPSADGTAFKSLSAFEMLSYVGQTSDDNGFQVAVAAFLVFPVIPIVGFFFCALDRKRNMKNIVSLLCCLAGVVMILLAITPSSITYGSMFSILLYIVIAFISSFSMMAWIIDSRKSPDELKQMSQKEDK